MCKESGYTLMELMVVVAIVAILSTVAIPAYVNYKNRSVQTEAIEALLRARMGQEVFWAENNYYASTIRMLASFGNTDSNSYVTASSYNVSVASATTNRFVLQAAKKFYSWAQTDVVMLTVSAQTPDAYPQVQNEDALKYSIFKWLFE